MRKWSILFKMWLHCGKHGSWCWGPMLTPKLKGGHEVTKPVYVEGAEVGDSVAIYIKDLQVTSIATSSGKDVVIEGRYEGDPFVAKRCPSCGTERPETRIEGTGPDAIRCAVCGADVAAFKFENGYTIVFDHEKGIGINVSEEIARAIGENPRYYMQTPANSVQNPVVCWHRMIWWALWQECAHSWDNWVPHLPFRSLILTTQVILANCLLEQPMSTA